MSKKSKALQKQVNKSKKRAIRDANRARYQAMAKLGENTKSKRFVSKSKRKVNTTSHPDGRCYNIGCKICDPCDIHK